MAWIETLLAKTGDRGAARWLVAIALATATVGLRLLLGDLLAGAQFITLFPAVIAATFFGGLGPGLLTMAVGAAGVCLLVIGPHESATPANLLAFAAFLLVAGFDCLIIRSLRELLRDRLQDRRRLQAANEGLEESVAEGIEALRRREALARQLFNLSPVPQHSLDREGRYVAVSDAWTSLVGYSRAEVVGRDFRELLTPESRAVVEQVTPGFARTDIVTGVELEFRRRDGGVLPVAVSARIQRDENGRFVRTHGVLTDLSARRAAEARLAEEEAQRRRAEDQLRQAQKMEAVGQLTGGVAHDFNNLLTVIIGNLDVLRRKGEGLGEPALARLDACLRAADRAALLTRQLLAFSRRQPLAPKTVDANKLVAGMGELLRRTLGEQVQLETVLAGGLWRLQADPNQLENALINLAINARDAMPGGGRLTVETGNAGLDDAYAARHEDVAPGQYVSIAVTDTGTGMAPEVAARVLEPFFTTKEAGRGSGLGLSQVYGFVKQSQGHLTIYSEPGQGTTVRLYLPRSRAAETEDVPRAEAPAPGGSETLLVVEDDAAVRSFVIEALAGLGYRTVEADSGPAALAALEREPAIRLLFTDIGLPGGMTGRELADAARTRRPGLKILFTTGYTQNAIIHNGVLDPGVQFIGKPFTAAQLAEKLRKVFDADA